MRVALTLILVPTLCCQDTLVAAANAQETAPDTQEEQPEDLPAPRISVPTRPVPVIDQSLAGWGAATPTGQIGNTIRANWVMLDDAGGLEGSVAGAMAGDTAGMQIFALTDGNVIGETRADSAGNFRLDNLRPGNYALIGYSPWSFFGWGFNAVEFRSGMSHLPRRIATRAVAARDNKLLVSELLQENSPAVRFRSYGEYPIGQDNDSLAAWFGWEGLTRFDVSATPATTIFSRQIRLGPGGKLVGRVHQIDHRDGRPVEIERTSMLLAAGGRVLGETRCNRRGVFAFAGIRPGRYNLVAVGTDGFAAMGVDVSSGGAPGARLGQVGGYRYDYFGDRRPVADTVSLSLMHGEAVGWANHFLGEQELAEARAMPRQQRPGYCPGCRAIVVNVRVGCPHCGR